jgi:uncharacterized membrane protein YraQ (UPF0718 family)/copper chaperone CopZ
VTLLQAVWDVLLELAPWLMLGMAVAGVLHVVLPRGFVHRQFQGPWGVVKAVLLGVPLPLCSCGVIPAGLGLRKDGASPGATVGFLISTPQTGVDSILVSASFLGWPFAIFKVAAAAVTGLVGGWLADAVGDGFTPDGDVGADAADQRKRGLRDMLDHALEILRTIWVWIVFGVVASALITVFVPDGWFESVAGRGVALPVLLALAVSLPLYVCATASVPIAAALVAGGFPPGAALVFLMAGPATNVATIGAIRRFLGNRALAAYLVAIVGGSVGLGIAFDFLLRAETTMAVHDHGDVAWWKLASTVVLVLLLAWFAFDDLRNFIARRAVSPTSEGTAIEIVVAGMTCQGCVSKLETALRKQPGVSGVRVELDPGKAIVDGSVDRERLHRVVEEAGFRVGTGTRT